jgi:hypothetical protein
MRKIWLIRRIWATLAARILRGSRIFHANGTLAHSWGLRDDGAHGHRRGASTDDLCQGRLRVYINRATTTEAVAVADRFRESHTLL